MMKQRVQVTYDDGYYPQYKWLFWWRHYRHESNLSFVGTTWKERRGERVWFDSESAAVAYLDKQYTKKTSGRVKAWIIWKPKQ